MAQRTIDTQSSDFLLGKLTPGMPSYRDLSLGMGDQQAILDRGQGQAADISQNTPNVGNQILDILRQYQKYGRQTETQGLQQQASRMFQTSPDLIGASPSLQSSVRNASVDAVQPTIGGARSLVEEAKDLLYDYQLKTEGNQKKAQGIIDSAISSGSSGLEELMRVQPEIFKAAGTNTKAYEAVLKGMKAQESEKRRQFDVLHKNSGNGSNSSLTSYQLIQYQNQIEDNFRGNPATKNYSELVNFGLPTVIDRFNKEETDSIADTILMRALAKTTDPTTGVREEEYRTFETAVGELNRLGVLPKKWVGRGRLTQEGRSQMIREIKDRFEASQEEYVNQYNYYNQQAGKVGLTIPPQYKVTSSPPASKSGLDKVLVTNPQGKKGHIPRNQLDAALKQGYKEIK